MGRGVSGYDAAYEKPLRTIMHLETEYFFIGNEIKYVAKDNSTTLIASLTIALYYIIVLTKDRDIKARRRVVLSILKG